MLILFSALTGGIQIIHIFILSEVLKLAGHGLVVWHIQGIIDLRTVLNKED